MQHKFDSDKYKNITAEIHKVKNHRINANLSKNLINTFNNYKICTS